MGEKDKMATPAKKRRVRLQYLVSRKGESIQRVASVIGISTTTLYKVLQGSRPSRSTKRVIAGTFERTENEILWPYEEKTPKEEPKEEAALPH